MRLCRRFAPTPFRLPIPISNFGGEGGIRTHDTVSRMPHFECGAFDQLSHLSISYLLYSILKIQKEKLLLCIKGSALDL
jgi:hypothetical protein